MTTCIAPMSLLFYQYSVLRAMQLPVMQFALFPFAFVSNINLFPNTVTDKISVLPSKKTNKQTNKIKQKKRRKIIIKNGPWNSVSPGPYIRSFAVFHFPAFYWKNYNNALRAFEFLARLILWKRRFCRKHCLCWVWLNRSPKTGLFY